MQFNRIYFFLKDDLTGGLNNIEITPQFNSEVILNTLSNINYKGKFYNFSSKNNCNESIYRKFHELHRSERIPFHESLFIFQLNKDFKKEYFIKDISDFAIYDLISKKIINHESLNTFEQINDLIFNAQFYEEEYFRNLVYFTSFLKLNDIKFLIVDCDKRVDEYVKDIQYVNIKN